MLETRKLGRTGLTVSEIGLRLSGDAARVTDLAVRAAKHGCRVFHVENPELVSALRRPGAIVSGPGGDIEIRPMGMKSPPPGGSKRFMLCEGAQDLRSALELPGIAGVAVPFNFAEQSVSELLPKAGRAGFGVFGVSALAGGSFAGPIGTPPLGAIVGALRSLVTPRRTFAQVAVQFALANMHIDCVLVRVSTVPHLEEVLAAPEAEPLEVSDLEKIFETYAHRYDDDPGAGCGGRR